MLFSHRSSPTLASYGGGGRGRLVSSRVYLFCGKPELTTRPAKNKIKAELILKEMIANGFQGAAN